MRFLLSIALIVICTLQVSANEPEYKTPLSKYSKAWDDPKYKVCNTAAGTSYLNATEKEIIYVLNMARMNPKLFCETVLPYAHRISDFIDTSDEVYYKSLVKEMEQMEPLGLLMPDQKCFVSAECHASASAKTGYVGHDRQSADCRKKQYFRGECCQYGLDDALGIVLNLLVDQDVESLGHRHICLGGYKKMSPAFRTHKKYGYNTVLDFHY